MRNKRKAVVGAIILVVLVTLAWGVNYYNTYRKANVIANSKPLYVYHDTEYNEMMHSIDTLGIMKNFNSFRRAADNLSLINVMQSGRYVFTEGMNNINVVSTIANGWQTPIELKIKSLIDTKEELASYLGEVMEADSTAFINALNNKELMMQLGFKDETYLSMFIPNKYKVYWTTSPESLLKRIKKEYDAFWNESRIAKAQQLNMSKEEVITLASIVIEETKHQEEMARVAGVYINRLKKGIPLQADPTVRYALRDSSINRLLRRHLKVDSPYNTYMHQGLPPGPITIAPIVAIDAVLNYEHHNYIYFCAKETFDGQHNFATNYSEHKENADRYQKALSERNNSNS